MLHEISILHPRRALNLLNTAIWWFLNFLRGCNILVSFFQRSRFSSCKCRLMACNSKKLMGIWWKIYLPQKKNNERIEKGNNWVNKELMKALQSIYHAATGWHNELLDISKRDFLWLEKGKSFYKKFFDIFEHEADDKVKATIFFLLRRTCERKRD